MRFNQMRDPMRDDAGFPAAGAGKQQKRPFDVSDSRLLLWIQTLQKVHEEEGNLILTCDTFR